MAVAQSAQSRRQADSRRTKSRKLQKLPNLVSTEEPPCFNTLSGGCWDCPCSHLVSRGLAHSCTDAAATPVAGFLVRGDRPRLALCLLASFIDILLLLGQVLMSFRCFGFLELLALHLGQLRLQSGMQYFSIVCKESHSTVGQMTSVSLWSYSITEMSCT